MTVSAEYEAKELATERKPAELFHIWYGSNHWYYTNGDVAILYDSNTYVPATINRKSMERDTQLSVTKMEIEFSYLNNPIVEYLAYNPVDLVWISIVRIFRDQTPYEGAAIFIGQIGSVVFQGNAGRAACVGFEYYLNRLLPLYRYQRQCNWEVFSTRCGLSSASYTQNVTVTSISSNGLIITCSGMTQKEANYYRYGRFALDGDERMITLYTGTQLYLRYKMRNVAVGSVATIYPGCDGNVATCRDKFNNVSNHGGHPYIPLKDVVIWGG